MFTTAPILDLNDNLKVKESIDRDHQKKTVRMGTI